MLATTRTDPILYNLYIMYGMEQLMTKASIVELRNNLAELLNKVQYGDERICITRNGKPIAAIISTDDLEYFEALEDYFDINEANKALEEAEREGTISWEDYLKEVG